MKLLLCPVCYEIRSLTKQKRKCRCGSAWGKYVDDRLAEYGGKAIPLGVRNESVDYLTMCEPFLAGKPSNEVGLFRIPDDSEWVRREGEK